MDNKEKILEATIKVFNRKGLKFTMDDIASELSMSKKTIYTVFRDKESLFYQMVDFCFDKIKEGEDEIINDDSLSTVEKIRGVLSVLPAGYKDVDFRQLYLLKDKYPNIYAKVEERLETGWEKLFSLPFEINACIFCKLHSIKVIKTSAHTKFHNVTPQLYYSEHLRAFALRLQVEYL